MKSRQLATFGVILVALVAAWLFFSRERKAPSTSSTTAETSSASNDGTRPGSRPGAQNAPNATPLPPPGLPLKPPAALANRLPAAARGPVTPSLNQPRDNPPPQQMVPPSLPPATGAAAEVRADFEKINHMLRDYRTLMNENPVGTNAEIMKAITGANPKGAKLGPPEGMALNGFGELVDPWGTPYFFHQISGTQMEIWSAGPDKKMGTSDDVIQK